jgi:chromosome segregation ATPase
MDSSFAPRKKKSMCNVLGISVRGRMKQLREMNDVMRYQLALMKIRSAIAKLHRLTRQKETLRIQRAFSRFKTAVANCSEQSTTKRVLENIKKTLKDLIKVRLIKEQSLLLRFVNRWRGVVNKVKVAKEVDKTIKATEEKLKKELKAKTLSVTVLENKFQQQVEEGKELKKVENSLREKLKEKEEQENSIKESLEKLRKRDSQGNNKISDNKLQSLKTNLIRLENENRELKEKLDTTESSVDGFVKEVNELLDSHEFECNST